MLGGVSVLRLADEDLGSCAVLGGRGLLGLLSTGHRGGGGCWLPRGEQTEN